MNRIFKSIKTICCLLLYNFELPFGHAGWPLFTLIFIYLFLLLFIMELASCYLCLPLVSEINKK